MWRRIAKLIGIGSGNAAGARSPAANQPPSGRVFQSVPQATVPRADRPEKVVEQSTSMDLGIAVGHEDTSDSFARESPGLATRASIVRADVMASGLRYPARVTHPTFNGKKVYSWKVIIEEICVRREETNAGSITEDLTFRGFSENEGWCGMKNFFISQVIRIEDMNTGEIFENTVDATAWIRRLCDENENRKRLKELEERDRRLDGSEDGLLVSGIEHQVFVQYGEERYRATIIEIERWGGRMKFSANAERIPLPGQRRWKGLKTFYPNSMQKIEDCQGNVMPQIDAYLLALARAARGRKDIL